MTSNAMTYAQKCAGIARNITNCKTVLPAGLTDPVACVSFFGFESGLLTPDQVITHINSAQDTYNDSLLNICLNLPKLHDQIAAHGESSISEQAKTWYCDHIKQYACVTPLIMSKEEKARIARLHESWQQSSNIGLKFRECKLGQEKLPVADKRNIMVTAALPYVNNVPHLGNLIGCVLSADCIARYFRSRDYNTIYICGTDEYGTATETKALQEKITCKQLCDKYHKIHADVYKWFNISFDHFGRTTTPEQTKIAQDIFLDLLKQDKLVEKEVEQLYDPIADMFLADRFVEGTCPKCSFEDARGDQCDGCGGLLNAVELINPRSKVEINGKPTGATPEKKISKHMFIKLDEIQPELRAWLSEGLFKDKVTSKNTKSIAGNWLKKGLDARCITRDLKWGTKVPLDDPVYLNKVFYVWFDAPIGYISITACFTENWKQWWFNPEQVEYFQFMAKDNVPFHSIVFPCSLLGTKQNWTKVSSLCATEYLNYENGKFSKSRGVGVFGNHAMESGIASDYWRYYLFFVRPEEKDSEFNWSDFQSKVNGDLLNNLGNFCNRPLNLVAKFWDGKLPEWEFGLDARDLKLVEDVDRELQTYIHCLEHSHIRDALRAMLRISALGNGYLQETQPWKLRKTNEKRAGQAVAISIQLVALIVPLLEPFMPDTSRKILDQLGIDSSRQAILPDTFTPLVKGGHAIGKPVPLIQKISDDDVALFREKYKGQQGV